VQLAKHWGIKTINIVRRDEYVKDLKALGADEVINSSTEGPFQFTKQI
jgi:NADPH:quinone reductase-like Zn-dependent oxidoreductase